MRKLGRKLTLKKETVRELNRNELQDVVGGYETEIVPTICISGGPNCQLPHTQEYPGCTTVPGYICVRTECVPCE